MKVIEEKDYDIQAEEYKYSPRQEKEVRENILSKLYKLQNYNVTMDMFKGSNIRWKSIQIYMTIIRRMYAGTFDRYNGKSNIGTNILDFIQGLIDSGEEPLDKLDINGKEISIDDLMSYDLLTKHEVDYIYSSVGPKNNEPDLSISGTRNRHKQLSTSNKSCEDHATIVQQYSSNPIKTVMHDKLSYTLPTWIMKLKTK